MEPSKHAVDTKLVATLDEMNLTDQKAIIQKQSLSNPNGTMKETYVESDRNN